MDTTIENKSAIITGDAIKSLAQYAVNAETTKAFKALAVIHVKAILDPIAKENNAAALADAIAAYKAAGAIAGVNDRRVNEVLKAAGYEQRNRGENETTATPEEIKKALDFILKLSKSDLDKASSIANKVGQEIRELKKAAKALK